MRLFIYLKATQVALRDIISFRAYVISGNMYEDAGKTETLVPVDNFILVLMPPTSDFGKVSEVKTNNCTYLKNIQTFNFIYEHLPLYLNLPNLNKLVNVKKIANIEIPVSVMSPQPTSCLRNVTTFYKVILTDVNILPR